MEQTLEFTVEQEVIAAEQATGATAAGEAVNDELAQVHDRKPRKRYRNAARQLMDAQVAIENAINDPDILSALEVYAYDRARLEQGLALHREARDLAARQRAQYGEQHGTTDDINKSWDAARKMYGRTLAIARIVFKDNGYARTGLTLGGLRKRRLDSWLHDSVNFYTNLTERADWTAAMAQFGYSEEKLQQEHEVILGLAQFNARQEMRKGAAQDMTKVRDAKLRELELWIRTFKQVARIALSENEQWLEKLGFGAV